MIFALDGCRHEKRPMLMYQYDHHSTVRIASPTETFPPQVPAHPYPQQHTTPGRDHAEENDSPVNWECRYSPALEATSPHQHLHSVPSVIQSGISMKELRSYSCAQPQWFCQSNQSHPRVSNCILLSLAEILSRLDLRAPLFAINYFRYFFDGAFIDDVNCSNVSVIDFDSRRCDSQLMRMSIQKP